jgi:hypothetical protein
MGAEVGYSPHGKNGDIIKGHRPQTGTKVPTMGDFFLGKG